MTDKEDKTSLSLDSEKNLLMLAAKACGMTTQEALAKLGRPISLYSEWNPITDDGDCFRLETALEIDIEWHTELVKADGFVTELYADHNGDKDKARRYASTRAAALRGRE